MNPDPCQCLQGAPNFREIGGLPVSGSRRMRTGLLFRSDELSRLTAQDQQTITALGLKLVCDLRTPNERKSRPARLPRGAALNIVSIPIQPMDRDVSRLDMLRMLFQGAAHRDFKKFLLDYYQVILFERTAQVRQVFTLLSDPANLPALVHCTAGKDRTGVLAALVQLLAGVSRPAVLEEYLLTNRCFTARVREFTRYIRWASLFQVSTEDIQHVLEARPEYLESALDELHARYGSVEGYLSEAVGLPVEQIDRLKELLLE